MGVFKRIFADSTHAAEVIDGAKKGLDALVFTPEEKTAAGREAFALWIDFMRATTGQNLARRYLAFIILGLWAFLIVVGVAVGLYETLRGAGREGADFVFDVVGGDVSTLAMLVAAFYFGKNAIDQIIGTWASKKGSK